ncbi:MAG: hypothetical protein AMXMBFR13_16010 [Phycisphaerae bacterium]|jgi:phosphocarrier protein
MSPKVLKHIECPLPEFARTVTVPNSQGLHARPVMRFVDVAGQYQSRVFVRKGDRVVDGKNPMEMMLLEATQGTVLELLAEGPDATEALEALGSLVSGGFGEE